MPYMWEIKTVGQIASQVPFCSESSPFYDVFLSKYMYQHASGVVCGEGRSLVKGAVGWGELVRADAGQTRDGLRTGGFEQGSE